MDDLALLLTERERLYGPLPQAWLMRFLRGRHHGCGRTPCRPGCDQRGRWYIGKWLLRSVPRWAWEAEVIALNTLGAILALLVVVICVVAALLLLIGQGLGASTEALFAVVFVLIGLVAVARLT